MPLVIQSLTVGLKEFYFEKENKIMQAKKVENYKYSYNCKNNEISKSTVFCQDEKFS